MEKKPPTGYIAFYGHGYLDSSKGRFRGWVKMVGAAGRLQRFRNLDTHLASGEIIIVNR